MADQQFSVNLAMTADTGQAKAQLQDLQKQLSDLTKNGAKSPSFGLSEELQKSIGLAAQLKAQLSNATNSAGKLDLSQFNNSLKQSKTSLQDYRDALLNLGPSGEQAFNQLANSISQAEMPVRRLGGLLDNFATTLKNTAKWQISSNIIHGLEGALNQAFGYAKNLDESLTNIRIVTGQTSDQMAVFAEKANKAAQALSTTTTQYTDAALIFYQQGLNDSEVEKRTNATIKMAQATGDSAKDVSSYMTAIWNNFDDGSKSLEHYADVITALGASTASSSSEISEGLSKFAAIANTTGLSYEYATASLATLVANTRESADTIGNSLKTIFSRLQGLKLGETLEDGTDLNKYSQALATIGVNVKDANGDLRDMDDILQDMSGKWQQLERDQKMALAQTVAGTRQYATLMALMDNWDDMEQNLQTTMNADGTLQNQADIYADSWEAAKNRVKASMEDIYDSLIDKDFFIGLDNVFATLLKGVSNLINGLGGVKGTLSTVGAYVMAIFSKQIAKGIDDAIKSIHLMTKKGQQEINDLKTTATGLQLQNIRDKAGKTTGAEADSYKREADAKAALVTAAQNLNAEEQQYAQLLSDIVTQEGEQVRLAQEKERLAMTEASSAKRKFDQNFQAQQDTSPEMLANIRSAREELERAVNADNITSNFTSQLRQLEDAGVLTFNNIKNAKENFDKQISNAGGISKMSSEFQTAYNELTQALAAGDEAAATKAAKALQDMENASNQTATASQTLKTTLQSMGYDVTDAQVQELISALQSESNAHIDTANSANNQEAALRQLQETLARLNAESQKQSLGQQLVGIARGITGLASGMNTIKGLGDIWTSGNGGLENLLTTVTSLSASLPMVITGIKAMAGVVGGPLTAVLAIGAAVKGVFDAIKEGENNAIEKSIEAAEKSKEVADAAIEKAETQRDALKSFEDAYKDWDRATGEGKEALVAASEEVVSAYQIENAELLIATENYEKLAEAIKKARAEEASKDKADIGNALDDAEKAFEDKMRGNSFDDYQYTTQNGRDVYEANFDSGVADEYDYNSLSYQYGTFNKAYDKLDDKYKQNIQLDTGNDEFNIVTDQGVQGLKDAYETAKALQQVLYENGGKDLPAYQQITDYLAEMKPQYEALVELQDEYLDVAVESDLNEIFGMDEFKNSLNNLDASNLDQVINDLTQAFIDKEAANGQDIEWEKAEAAIRAYMQAYTEYGDLVQQSNLIQQTSESAGFSDKGQEALGTWYDKHKDEEGFQDKYIRLNFDIVDENNLEEELDAQIAALQAQADADAVLINLKTADNAVDTFKPNMSADDYAKFEGSSGLDWGQNMEGLEDPVIAYTDFLRMSEAEQKEYLQGIQDELYSSSEENIAKLEEEYEGLSDETIASLQEAKKAQQDYIDGLDNINWDQVKQTMSPEDYEDYVADIVAKRQVAVDEIQAIDEQLENSNGYLDELRARRDAQQAIIDDFNNTDWDALEETMSSTAFANKYERDKQAAADAAEEVANLTTEIDECEDKLANAKSTWEVRAILEEKELEENIEALSSKKIELGVTFNLEEQTALEDLFGGVDSSAFQEISQYLGTAADGSLEILSNTKEVNDLIQTQLALRAAQNEAGDDEAIAAAKVRSALLQIKDDDAFNQALQSAIELNPALAADAEMIQNMRDAQDSSNDSFERLIELAGSGYIDADKLSSRMDAVLSKSERSTEGTIEDLNAALEAGIYTADQYKSKLDALLNNSTLSTNEKIALIDENADQKDSEGNDVYSESEIRQKKIDTYANADDMSDADKIANIQNITSAIIDQQKTYSENSDEYKALQEELNGYQRTQAQIISSSNDITDIAKIDQIKDIWAGDTENAYAYQKMLSDIITSSDQLQGAEKIAQLKEVWGDAAQGSLAYKQAIIEIAQADETMTADEKALAIAEAFGSIEDLDASELKMAQDAITEIFLADGSSIEETMSKLQGIFGDSFQAEYYGQAIANAICNDANETSLQKIENLNEALQRGLLTAEQYGSSIANVINSQLGEEGSDQSNLVESGLLDAAAGGASLDVADAMQSREYGTRVMNGTDQDFLQNVASGNNDAYSSNQVDAVNSYVDSIDWSKMDAAGANGLMNGLEALDNDVTDKLIEGGILDKINEGLETMHSQLDEDVDEGQWTDLTKKLQKMGSAIEGVSDDLKTNDKEAQKVASDILRYGAAVDKVEKSSSKWEKELADTTKVLDKNGKVTAKYEDTISDVKDTYGDLLGMDGSALSDEFAANADNLKLMEEAANGSEEAYEQLQEAAGKDILAQCHVDTSQFEEDLNTIESMAATANGELLDDLEVGASLDNADFLAALSDMVNAAGMTADQATSYLASMGVDAEVEEVTSEGTETNEFPTAVPTISNPTITASVPQFTTGGTVSGGKDGKEKFTNVVVGGNSTGSGSVPSVQYNTSTETETATKENKAFALKVTSANKSSGGGFKKSQSGGGGGGGGGRGGGGGGGRGRGGRARTTTARAVSRPDVSHNTQNNLKQTLSAQTSAYDRLAKAGENAFGKAKLKNMDAEIEKQKEIIASTQKLTAETKKLSDQELKRIKGLSKVTSGEYVVTDKNGNQSVETSKDFSIAEKLKLSEKEQEEFSFYGDLLELDDSKYLKNEAIIEAKLAKREADVQHKLNKEKNENKKRELENELAQIEAENATIREQLELYKSDIDAYWEGIEQEAEARLALEAKQLEKIEYKLNLTIEIEDEKLQVLEQKLGRLQKTTPLINVTGAGESLNLQKAEYTNLTNQQASIKTQMTANRDAAKELLMQNGLTEQEAKDYLEGKTTLQNASKKDKSWMSNLSPEEMESLKGYRESLMDLENQYEEINDQIAGLILESMEQWLAETDKELDKLNSGLSTLEHYQNVIDIVGKKFLKLSNAQTEALRWSTVDQKQAIANGNKDAYNTAERAKNQAQKVYNELVKQYEASYAQMSATEKQAAQEQISQAKATLDQATQEVQSRLQNWQAAVEEALQAAKDACLAAITDFTEELMDPINKAKEARERAKELREGMLDTTTKNYELSKLTNDIEKSINDSNNIKNKQALAQVLDKVNRVRESGVQLSEYEANALRKEYEIELARLKLEEAREAKSEVRMTRDSEGNFSYVYTADQSAVEEAESEYKDKLQEAYELNRDYIDQTQDMLLGYQEEANEKLNELAQKYADGLISKEEFEQEAAVLKEHYQKLTEQATAELQRAMDNQNGLYENYYTKLGALGEDIAGPQEFIDQWNELDLSKVFDANINSLEAFGNKIGENIDAIIAKIRAEKIKLDQENTETLKDEDPNFNPNKQEDIYNLVGKVQSVETTTRAVSRSIDDVTSRASTSFTTLGTTISTWATTASSSFNEINDIAETTSETIQGLRTYLSEHDTYKENGGASEFAKKYGNADNNFFIADASDSKNKTVKYNENSIRADLMNRGVSDATQQKAVLDELEKILKNNYSGYTISAFDTGGYTGDWGSEGKLAMLHEKELVLNQSDTNNLLKAVTMIRDLSEIINLNAAMLQSDGFNLERNATMPDMNQTETLEQYVTITLDAPNLTDKNSILEAFDNVINLASQYAHKK